MNHNLSPFACHVMQSLNVQMTLVSVPQHGLTALILAIQEGHTETVRTLLAAGADVNLQEKVDQCNYASCTNQFQTTRHSGFLEHVISTSCVGCL